MTLFYTKEDISKKYKPGIDPVPYYVESVGGVKCLKCGATFIGIHCCMVK
jgi:hypothetical protein